MRNSGSEKGGAEAGTGGLPRRLPPFNIYILESDFPNEFLEEVSGCLRWPENNSGGLKGSPERIPP